MPMYRVQNCYVCYAPDEHYIKGFLNFTNLMVNVYVVN